MRKSCLSPAAIHTGPNMTPLVDIVMVILIFLMLAGSFGVRDHHVQAKVPAGSAVSGPTDPTFTSNPQIEIHVYRSASGMDVMQMSGYGVVSDNDVLAAELQARHAEYRAAGRADDVQVIIRPSPDVASAPVIATYDAALRAQFKQIDLAKAH